MALTAAGGERTWLKRWPAWVERASAVHGGKYSYPSPVRMGAPGRWKVTVVCPEHGVFEQVPQKHMHGAGCAQCAGLGTNKLQDLKNKFPDWDWSGTVVGSSKGRFTLSCPEHGTFETLYNRLMNRGAGLSPCPSCNQAQAGEARQLTVAEWEHRVRAVHGERYRLLSIDAGDRITLSCPEHGAFTGRRVDVTVSGSGCPKCAARARLAWSLENRLATPEEFVSKARAVHGDRYDYDLSTFVGNKRKVRIICKVHGEFWQKPGNHLHNQTGCPHCVGSVSTAENEIAGYVESLGFTVERRNRELLGGWEIDVYVPERKLAIEYGGLYWHGEHHKSPSYHGEKLRRAEAAGISLITVFEDEWLEKSGVVKQVLQAKLGKLTGVHARHTELVSITWTEAKAFLNKWHLQGAGQPASICHALRIDGNVYAVAAWGRSRYEPGKLELYRFCSAGIRVKGGLSKLVNAVREPGRTLLTYADLRWGSGAGYGAVGFTSKGRTEPNYFWCKGSSRHNRQKFQKHKLAARLKVFDPLSTEVENCHRNGYWRVYDCGNSKWELVCT